MSNRTCVIVGMGTGVGLAVAKRFAREGFRIAMIARREAALEEYATALKQAGAEAHGFAADAADFTSLKNAFDQIKQQLGTPEVLVYNAAVLKQGKPSQLDVEDFIYDFRVNVAAALVCVQQVLEPMRLQKQGTILFTGGGLAFQPSPAFASLAIGKAGLRSLCYSLGEELQKDGIHVATVTICGFVQPGTHFDPDLIAQEYWKLHSQAPGSQEREVVYQ